MSNYKKGLELLGKRAAINTTRLDAAISDGSTINLILLDGTKVLISIEDVEMLGDLAEEMGNTVAWRVWRSYAKRAASFNLSVAELTYL